MKEKPSIRVAGPSVKHVPALDGVRGLAILMVLVFHLMLFNNHSSSRIGNVLASIRGLGWTGVDLFFVLSGFLITGILYDTVSDSRYFRSFYMRRFLRIFPLYYGFLFFLLIFTHPFHIVWGGRQYVLLTYTQNTGIWFPVTDFRPSHLADLDHFWSLAVEEQFYLFWPLLVLVVRQRRWLIGLTLALSGVAVAMRIALYLRGASPDTIFMATPCRMDTLLLGGCLALMLRGDSNRILRRWRRWMIPAALAAAVVVTVYTLHYPGPDMRAGFFGATFSYLVIALGGVALLVAALDESSIAHRIFKWQILRSLGKYSYGIYVLHIFVAHVFGIGVERVLGTSLRIFLTPWLHSRVLAVLVEFGITVAVVFAVAYLSYNLYEVHFLKLKRYFGYHHVKPLQADPQPPPKSVALR